MGLDEMKVQETLICTYFLRYDFIRTHEFFKTGFIKLYKLEQIGNLKKIKPVFNNVQLIVQNCSETIATN